MDEVDGIVDVRPEESLSVAGRPLPLPLQSSTSTSTSSGTATTTAATEDAATGTGTVQGTGEDSATGSIVLFYQYKEPMWTDHEFGRAIKLFLQICNQHQMKGRGRIAREGVNCTLSNVSPNKMRSFCTSLRDPSVWTINNNDDEDDNDDNDNNNDVEHDAHDHDTDGDEHDDDKPKRKPRRKTLFEETDFKITDGIPSSKLFKSLTVRKVDELVAYGLDGPTKAPSIKQFGGTHLTAIDYHDALKDPNTVVVDVRNAYETAIGTIRPPPGGAKLLDPKMRNSHEWPKWLASKETQQQLHGKKVLTFCTGGIRCERATALINQMAHVAASSSSSNQPQSQAMMNNTQGSGSENHHPSQQNDDVKLTDAAASSTKHASVDDHAATANSNATSTAISSSFKPEGVYHMRGGIERYLRTFPSGGYWQGKNYLFDKRIEQVPEKKSLDQVKEEIVTGVVHREAASASKVNDHSTTTRTASRNNNTSSTALTHAKCCICRCPWTTYRGKFKCQMPDCGVPVLVCDTCAVSASQKKQQRARTKKSSHGTAFVLQCELCREGYRAPQNMPDLAAMKRQAEKLVSAKERTVQQSNSRRSRSLLGSESNSNTDGQGVETEPSSKRAKIQEKEKTASSRKNQRKAQDRLFLSKLPLSIRRSQIEEWLKTPVVNISWLVDHLTGSFYGSCIVEVDKGAPILKQILNTKDSTSSKNTIGRQILGLFPGTTIGHGIDNKAGKKRKKKPRQPKISPVFLNENSNDEWPPKPTTQTEFPPIGYMSKLNVVDMNVNGRVRESPAFQKNLVIM
mmetsp:Transcript_27059/g.64647  ORF Transcript_27059/g.64647 Transcript_27059/m.64647 type:complete len:796 (+) Transcript_27059:272-2659(+)